MKSRNGKNGLTDDVRTDVTDVRTDVTYVRTDISSYDVKSDVSDVSTDDVILALAQSSSSSQNC